MGLRHGSAKRQFILQTAQGAAMVLGQHRISSHPSSQPTDSQLSPGKMPPGRAAVSDRETRHAVLQFQILHLPPLGRTAAPAGRLPPPQDHAPATAAGGPVLTTNKM